MPSAACTVEDVLELELRSRGAPFLRKDNMPVFLEPVHEDGVLHVLFLGQHLLAQIEDIGGRKVLVAVTLAAAIVHEQSRVVFLGGLAVEECLALRAGRRGLLRYASRLGTHPHRSLVGYTSRKASSPSTHVLFNSLCKSFKIESHLPFTCKGAAQQR